MIELGDPLPDLAIDVYDDTDSLSDGGAVSVLITRDGVTLASGGAVIAGGTLLSVVHPGTGRYTTSYTPAVTGQITVKWTITGANAGVQTTDYTIETPVSGIVGLADVKEFLRINRSDQDGILTQLILEASDLCESSEGSGKTWRRTVVTDEQHTADGRLVQLFKFPVASITGITVDGVTQSLTGVTVSTGGMLSSNGYGFYSSSPNTLLISYVAGGGPIPSAIRGGTLEMIRYLYGTHRGGSNLPRQQEPDYNTVTGYLIPNRVMTAWRSKAAVGF